MPSPMSGRGKELMGYKVTDTHLLVGALVIFVAVRPPQLAQPPSRPSP